MMDEHNPVVTMIIKGKEVSAKIIDGGSCVNVIREHTCHNLGIHEWEPMTVLVVNGKHEFRPTNGTN